ncbi:cytosolic sulfotransferase 18-like [Dorcoceras hygrometricum]|uniref:Cytosolic sulfotransferase 18-like n=1 Tax=Dorcoceras hygrometricum TaxID=472368 RepID=A0A2Z7BCM9_9LAMI|nr:cytosolic sulfotransferase 18-like [Dorcoceras hygrometricum]
MHLLICSTISALNTKRLTNTCRVLIKSHARALAASRYLFNATTEKRNDDASLTCYSRNLKCATTDFLALALRLISRSDSVLLLRHQQLITDFINSRNC